jgi:hypothetical protein
VASSPSVGVFTSSAVAFSRRVAGAVSALSANFTLARALAAGETVTLSLPSFLTPAGAADPLVLSLVGADAGLFDAAFSAGASALTLELAGPDALPAGTPVSVMVPSSAGLTLPTGGVASSGSGIRIATNASSGPVASTDVASVQGVGAFTSSTVHFGAAAARDSEAGRASAVALAFRFSAPLAAGETVTLSLPGFAAPGGAALATLAVDSFEGMLPLRVAWDNVSESLAITAGNTVSAATAVALTVAASNGLVVAAGGVRRDEPGVTLATDAAAAPAEASRVASVEPVGLLAGIPPPFSLPY